MNINNINNINALQQYVVEQGFSYEVGDGSRKHQLNMCNRFADGVSCMSRRIAEMYPHLCSDGIYSGERHH